MPEEGFPLPQSSYKEVAKIIKAYGTFASETVPSEVGKVAVMHETVVSRNNRFLTAIGVLEGVRKKRVTERGRALAQALEYEMPEEIKTKWQDIVSNSDFLQKLIAAVRIRKGMDEASFEAHVAYSAGQPKTSGVMAGARAVVEILKAAEALREEDGKLTSTAPMPTEPPVSESTVVVTALPPSQQRAVIALPEVSRADSSIPIRIEIQVQCSVAELEGLAPVLKRLVQEINKREGREAPGGEDSESHMGGSEGE
jgi:hypothetical protein